jgi:hypothetical protein
VSLCELEWHSPRWGAGIEVWKEPCPDVSSHDNAIKVPTVRQHLGEVNHVGATGRLRNAPHVER